MIFLAEDAPSIVDMLEALWPTFDVYDGRVGGEFVCRAGRFGVYRLASGTVLVRDGPEWRDASWLLR